MGGPAGDVDACISDGFYIMLRPLSPGEHSIRFSGPLDLPGLETDVPCVVTVEERASGRGSRAAPGLFKLVEFDTVRSFVEIQCIERGHYAVV